MGKSAKDGGLRPQRRRFASGSSGARCARLPAVAALRRPLAIRTPPPRVLGGDKRSFAPQVGRSSLVYRGVSALWRGRRALEIWQ
eukprot:scaffold986_cov237-Pinguiococcus_pyrenoidosus.AAC.16